MSEKPNTENTQENKENNEVADDNMELVQYINT